MGVFWHRDYLMIIMICRLKKNPCAAREASCAMSRHTTVACRNWVGTSVTWGYHWDDPQVMADVCTRFALKIGFKVPELIWFVVLSGPKTAQQSWNHAHLDLSRMSHFWIGLISEGAPCLKTLRMACRAEVVTTSRESNMAVWEIPYDWRFLAVKITKTSDFDSQDLTGGVFTLC